MNLLNFVNHCRRAYFYPVIIVIFIRLKPHAMIEYAKVILPKVSFSKFLFKKELRKCIAWMKPAELHELRQWCFTTFTPQYRDVLDEAFDNIAA